MWRVPDELDMPDYNPYLIVTVIGMLCLTVVLVAMALAGGSEAIGQVACTMLLAGAYLMYKRVTRQSK
jgi:uncharacterized membrane protein YdjX (TVP38/TMEM64 family)